ncbi:MAG: TetR/AcrR family transcriptional regulator [Acidobacteriota bacterium]|nr:TetR/AcrR family transcriptional regulator [Acidobacteriota bacterium]
MPDPVHKSAQPGRPRSNAAVSHAAIMDAVYELLQERPARDLTMEAVAKRANVGKPTLYKWWPSKAALILAMFNERLAGKLEAPVAATAEEAIRAKVRRLIKEFRGLFGKVMADLIAEGQSDPAILQELYESHIRVRRASTVEDIERGKATGEFSAGTNAELLVDAIFAPVYYRHLLRFAPLTEKDGSDLIDQVLLGVRKEPNLSTRKSHRRLRAKAHWRSSE